MEGLLGGGGKLHRGLQFRFHNLRLGALTLVPHSPPSIIPYIQPLCVCLCAYAMPVYKYYMFIYNACMPDLEVSIHTCMHTCLYIHACTYTYRTDLKVSKYI